ncbi:MAG: aminodeoxychorismate synthase component I [Xanthomonadales bacterium]|nr:aminodeoxychorismate synthase component I [Xanthomonadales bacterium]
MGGANRQWLSPVPDLVALGQAYPEEFPFLLESSGASPHGRASILLFAAGGYLASGNDGVGRREFLAQLANWFEKERIAHDPELADVPFRGGWFIYLGYEMAAAIEPVLRIPANPASMPDALACRCPGALVVFHDDDARRALAIAEDPQTLEQILERARQPAYARSTASPEDAPRVQVRAVTESDPEIFTAGVRRIHEYLLSGDVFQVNLSRLWHASLVNAVAPLDVYRALRQANPAPFSGVMRWAGSSILSSSPERLVEVRQGIVQTRPIAGTRPRSEHAGDDQALSRELIDNVKERAEHIMLIDLERNDLGRVCQPGSVEVSELMVVESYAHVHHIVSNVRGRLREGAGPVDVIRAVFPGGTITGCPKVRCMEIIAELEQEGRGFYTGSMGYLNRDGDLDLNILIRTMLQQGQKLSFRTGAGIVADSIPDRELAETRDKARGLLLALGSG